MIDHVIGELITAFDGIGKIPGPLAGDTRPPLFEKAGVEFKVQFRAQTGQTPPVGVVVFRFVVGKCIGTAYFGISVQAEDGR